jgi:TRAP-type uncharacterized transport system fused permease subunit
MSLEGIFVVPTGVSAKSIFVLVVFGTTMLKLGRGFLQFRYSLFGTVKEGQAKIAVATSTTFASITGLGSAKVAAMCVFIIPLMKKAAYKPLSAGKVELVASLGGQIVTPVMEAATFIMADLRHNLSENLSLCFDSCITLFYCCLLHDSLGSNNDRFTESDKKEDVAN